MVPTARSQQAPGLAYPQFRTSLGMESPFLVSAHSIAIVHPPNDIDFQPPKQVKAKSSILYIRETGLQQLTALHFTSIVFLSVLASLLQSGVSRPNQLLAYLPWSPGVLLDAHPVSTCQPATTKESNCMCMPSGAWLERECQSPALDLDLDT